MKKWNSSKKINDTNKLRHINNKPNKKLKNSKSTETEKLNHSKKKDISKLHKKNKLELITPSKLLEFQKNSNEPHKISNSHLLYYKKHVVKSPIKTEIKLRKNNEIDKKPSIKNIFYHKKISSENPTIFFRNKNKNNFNLNIINNINIKKDYIFDFNNIEEDTYNQNKKYKKLKSEINININKKASLEETVLNYSQNSEINNFINEIKSKINLSKKNIYELQKMNESNNMLNIQILKNNNNNNNKDNIKIDNPKDEKKKNNIKNIESSISSIINNSNSEFFSMLRQSKLSNTSTLIPEQEDEKILLSHIKILSYPKSMIKTINKLYKSIYDISQIIANIENKNNYNLINNKYEPLIVKYLDIKSLLLLSSTNKNIFKSTRVIIYRIIYEKILLNRSNNKEDFIKKIKYSIFKYSSNKLNIRNNIQLKTKYNFYLSYKSEFSDKIRQDLSRTFPQDRSFNTQLNHIKLYNVLNAYSNYNKLIGYTQGLNFIAATGLYFFNNEEEVFLFLDCLINRFQLEKYLSIKNEKLYDKYNYFCELLNKYNPSVIKFFEEKGLNHCFFSIGWMLTLFSNSMKRKYLIKTWCFMIIYGWKFFYCLTIQILNFYKNEILSKEENKLSDFMKSILNNDNFCNNYNSIIRNTLCFMIDNITL